MANPQQVYGLGGILTLFPEPIVSSRAPTANDGNFPLGQIWVDTSNDNAYILSSISSGSATWGIMSPGDSEVDTLTADSGGALSPAAGNITIAGGTNVTTSGSGSTITVNLDATVVLATSMSSPIYTVAAATDLAITAATGQDIIIKMGDAAGANKVSFVDSANAEVFAIDSNGTVAFTAVTVTDLTATGTTQILGNNASASTVTIASGVGGNTVSINNAVNTGANVTNLSAGAAGASSTVNVLSGVATAGTSTLNLNTGTGAITRNTNIGTGTAVVNGINIGGTGANVIAIGNTQTAGSVSIGDAMTSGTITIGGSGLQTGTVSIAPGTGAQTIDIGTGGTGVKTISVGTGAIGNVIAIGTVTGAASVDLKVGTGNFTLEGDVASTYDISATGVNTGTVRIASGTGARTVEIAGGGTGAKTINIGAAASADVITIGTSDGAGSLDLAAGTGNFTLEGATATTYDISNTGVNTGTVSIAGGTGARTINIAGGGTGAKTINIGAAASADVITIGTSDGAGSLDLAAGTGNFTLEGATATTYDISATGVNTGTVRIGSGTGARTVEIAGGGTGAKTINIGAAASADVITIGTTTGAGSLTLSAGTGEITVNGTVKEIDAEFLSRSGDNITFQQSPILQSNLTTGAAPTGATGDVNLMTLQEGIVMEQFILGTGQTIIAPRMSAAGLLVSLDLVAAEGAAYNFGGARNNSRHAFTIGTSAAFFCEWQFTAATVAGADPYYCGFRKVEANNSDYESYTDFAFIGLNQPVNSGTVIISSRLNSGAVSNTNTTDAWTDGQTHTLRVLVSGAGVVTYLVDGVAPSVTAAFTFDNGDVVVPEFFLLHRAGAAAVDWVSMKIGFQS